MRAGLAVANVVLAVAYPVAVWWSLTHFSARMSGLFVLIVLVPVLGLRLWQQGRQGRGGHFWHVIRIPLSVMFLLTMGIVFDERVFMLWMPVLISAVLLVQFAASLRGDMPIVERFARMQEPELGEPERAHCRQVTIAWCVFFVINGTVAAALSVVAPLSWWAAYSGGVAYALMALMFAGEYGVRRLRFQART